LAISVYRYIQTDIVKNLYSSLFTRSHKKGPLNLDSSFINESLEKQRGRVGKHVVSNNHSSKLSRANFWKRDDVKTLEH
jgi:hypothetical protein